MESAIKPKNGRKGLEFEGVAMGVVGAVDVVELVGDGEEGWTMGLLAGGGNGVVDLAGVSGREGMEDRGDDIIG